MTKNIYVAILAELGLLAWMTILLPLYLIIATRNMLAWALDGLMPSKLADVDETHSPIRAIAVAVLLGIVALWIYAYLIPYSTISGLFGQLVGTYLVTCIAAVFFPWRQPEMFESSPVSWRIGGIPVLCIVAVAGAIDAGTIGWAFLNDPFSGVNVQQPLLLIINVLFFLSGFGVFWLVKRCSTGNRHQSGVRRDSTRMSLFVLIRTQARMIAHISEIPLLSFRCRSRILLLAAAHESVRNC